MAPKPVTNRFQKEHFRRGERRLRWKEVQHYLKLADSEQAQDRIEAMENLCPCHVRQRIDDVRAALYRGMVDNPMILIYIQSWLRSLTLNLSRS